MYTRVARSAVRLAAWSFPLVVTAGCMVHVDGCDGSGMSIGGHTVSQVDGKLVVDGVRLEHDRWIEVDLPADGLGQLSVETATGRVELRGGAPESCKLSVHVHSSVEGDGEVRIKDGKLVVDPKEKGKVFIDGVKGSVPEAIALVVSTSTGDVLIEQAAKGKSLSIDTGAGEITVRGSEPASLDVQGGAADVQLEQGGATSVKVELGAGDVRIVEGQWGKIAVEGGATDVALKGSKVGSVILESGAGDLLLEACTVDSALLEVGAGDLVISGGVCKKARIDSGTGDIEVRDGAQVESRQGD